MISLTSLKILPNVEFNLLMELTLFPGVTVLVGLTQLVLIQQNLAIVTQTKTNGTLMKEHSLIPKA